MLSGVVSLQATAEDELIVNGRALLSEWVAPEYSHVILQEKINSIVTVRMIVDETGHVTTVRALEGSDPRFSDAAITAARQWVFKPAIEENKPVASCLDASVLFSPETAKRKLRPGMLPPLEEWPEPAPLSSAQERVSPSFDYPEWLEKRLLPGLVRFHYVVSAEGRVVSPRIITTSHADLVQPTFSALKRWKFTPQMEGDLPVATEMEAEFTFDSVVIKRKEMFVANSISALDGTTASVTPELWVVTDPVWPIGALLEGIGGSATAQFTIAKSGLVTDVRVREATQPEFGQALTAALETWLFSRPRKKRANVSVTLIKRAEFKPIPLDTSDNSLDMFAQLVVALRRGEIGSAKGLDGRLTPHYRVVPQYPEALKNVGGPAGQTVIEFIIDREGRARLPRIVSASHEAFGWAAATAVAQWVFAPPFRNGKPVDVKVRIPFKFAAQ